VSHLPGKVAALATSLVDRLTIAIRTAEQSMGSAQYQVDYRNWHEVHRVLQDVRDELGKPPVPMQLLQDVIGVDNAGQPIKRGPGRPRKEAA
jgi:hypothetical protein